MRELADPAFERGIGIRRRVEPLAPGVGQAQCQTPAIVRIGLAVDEAGADQRIDGAADRRRATVDPGGDLIERCRLGLADRSEQSALLAERLGGVNVAAQLLNQSRKAGGQRPRCRSPKHELQRNKYWRRFNIVLVKFDEARLRYRQGAAMTRR